MKINTLKLMPLGAGLLFITVLILTSCSKDKENVSLDKKITLTILDDHYGVGSGSDTTIYTSSIINFDKRDYSSIDSIFFVISDLKTTSLITGKDVVANVSVELFDLTNFTSISNSKINSDDVKASQFKSSSNILISFPNEPINLGIRVINTYNTSCSWELHAASLILKRK